MKTKIILDSTSCLQNGDLVDNNVEVEIVPLSLIINGEEHIDDGSTSQETVLDAVAKAKCKQCTISTACPSPQAYLSKFTGADNYLVITLGKKVSGSYNSAVLAKSMAEKPECIHVLDSQSACGVLELIARHAIECIKSGMSFAELIEEVESYKEKANILFIIEKFDSLIKTGRVSKLVASIASVLMIKPLGIAKAGEIKIYEKVRTIEGTIKRLIFNIAKLAGETKDKICIITHTAAKERAIKLKDMILEKFHFKDVLIRENSSVISYYALKGAVMVSF